MGRGNLGGSVLDGIYSMTFRGAADWGMGMLILQGGLIIGSDAGGVLYDGTYIDRGLEVVVNLKMTVPPGATLVQGTPARSDKYVVPVNAVISKSALEHSLPVLIQLPPGPVNVIFRRLRSLNG